MSRNVRYCKNLQNLTSIKISNEIVKSVQTNEHLQLVFLDNIKYVLPENIRQYKPYDMLLIFKEYSIYLLNYVKDRFGIINSLFFNEFCRMLYNIIYHQNGEDFYKYLLIMNRYKTNNLEEYVVNKYNNQQLNNYPKRPPRPVRRRYAEQIIAEHINV